MISGQQIAAARSPPTTVEESEMTSKYDKQRRLLRIALLFLLLPAAISTAMAQTRDPLADLKLPSATIVSVEFASAGQFSRHSYVPAVGRGCARSIGQRAG
jgi:hypothetical protein